MEGAFNFEYWPFSEKLEKWPRRGKRKEGEGRVEMGEREGGRKDIHYFCKNTPHPLLPETLFSSLRVGGQLSSLLYSMRVGFLDIHPTLYGVSSWWNRLDSVLCGLWRTGMALP